MLKVTLMTLTLLISLGSEAQALDILYPGGDLTTPVPGTKQSTTKFKPCSGPVRTIGSKDKLDSTNDISCHAYSLRIAGHAADTKATNPRGKPPN